ncbi:hypothetical protein M8J75_000584 [Diaphorina citri]|nr:hypothetical protein M8J75_000584 [Diaphorina citri]
MDSMTLASTPNWFLNQVMTVNHDCSLFAYCVRTDIVIMKNAYAANAFGIEYKTIRAAHKDRAAGCVFSPVTDPNKPFYKHLVSFGDDGSVRMWNLTNGKCVMVNNAHTKQIESGHKIVGIDWLKTDPHVIVSVSDNSVVVRWALEANSVKEFVVRARVFPQCIAASPHDKDVVAIGAKCAHVVIYSMKSGHGTLLGRVRCGDNDIMCLSWCPIPSDVIYDKPGNKPKYLVAGTKDYGVFIVNTNSTSKAKNDCAQLTANIHLPRSPMNKNQRFSKAYKKDHGWSVVCWCGPHTILTTSRYAEVITFQTEPLQANKENLQFKFKLVHDRHNSKPILSLACPQTTDVDVSMDQVIWTLAVDRHLIRYSLHQRSLTLDLHTCTSYVYSLALSIVPDQSRLAIGLGEGKILIWNMFKRAFLDMTEIWQKIEGKVMTLCFHPSKEGWLAYGTSSGSVGVVELGGRAKGPFVTYSLEKSHLKGDESDRMAVYSLRWGPNPSFLPVSEEQSKEPCFLYGVSNGDVYVFTPSSKIFKANPPTSLKSHLTKIDLEAGQPENTRRTDLCWKPDFSAVAIANENGSIYILSPELELVVTLLEHKKLINTQAWHPEYISLCESPYKNWLATGSDNIKVFNIDPENINLSRQPVATLSLHSQRITCVAWNPHVNGQLLSTSYDNVAQVWDVLNQTPLVSYHGHMTHVMSGLWSPLDPDLIITGSGDGTVQCWRMSKQTTTRPSDKKKVKNIPESAPVATSDVTSEEITSEYKEPSKSKGNHTRKAKSVFPITGNQFQIGSHLHVLVNRFVTATNPTNPITIVKNQEKVVEDAVTMVTGEESGNAVVMATKQEGKDAVVMETKEEKDAVVMETKQKDAVAIETKQEKDAVTIATGDKPDVPLTNGVIHETNGQVITDTKDKTEDLDDVEKEVDNSALYLNFFGTRKDMENLVQTELTQHINNKYTTGALGTALWLGDFNIVVKMAIEKEELTDEIVGLSQTASLKLWRDCCEVYAKQLIASGNILKATNYLLAIHKVEEAVSLLLRNELYKEAMCLAKLRLPETHELIASGYRAWAESASSHGNYAQAAHIYLLLEDGVSAMKVLNKASDIRLQYYACILALNQSTMSNTSEAMLNNCFKRSLEKVPLSFAKEMVESHPNNKHFRLWYHGRQRSAEMLENTTVLSTWAEGSVDEDNIVDKIHADLKTSGVSSADVNALKELVNMCEGMDKAKVLVYISGHLAVASVESPPDNLKHILLALKVAYKLQSRIIVFPALLNAALYPKGPMESYPLLDKSFSPHPDYTHSIRAFFADSIVNWLYYCEEKNVDQAKLLDILEHTVNNYIEDVITIDTVSYYKAQADLAALESALCQQIVKDNIIKKVDSIENLNLFKPKPRNSRTPSPTEKEEENKTEQEKGDGENKGEGGNDEAKGEGKENDENKKRPNENEMDNEGVEKKAKTESGEEGETKKLDEETQKPDGEVEKPDGEVEKPDGETEKPVEDVNALQDFEKATNPNYDVTRADEDEDEEEELTRDEKVQRIKELQEIITNFEASRIYAPNPSNVFDLVFKVLKSLDLNETEAISRVRELTELMNTHAEAFELA